jgi:hypothetical protein
MDTVQFLLCFRRFMSFYGPPELVVCDNAGQFVNSRRILDKLWAEACQSPEVQEFSASKGISWKFIVEAAPWMGGFYERLVGVVKTSLKAVFDRKRLDLVEFQTVIYEVTAVVNSRPLVYSEEIGDVALTPSHLIMRHRTIFPFVSVVDPKDTALPSTRNTQKWWIAGWKRIQNLLHSFWKSWQKQYLLSLRERARGKKQRNVSPFVPVVGEVVLIADDHLPRSQWKYGRIKDLIFSADERCRSATILLPGGISLNRPIKLLYPLEVRDAEPYNRVGTKASPHVEAASEDPTQSADSSSVVERSSVQSPGNSGGLHKRHQTRAHGAARVVQKH